MNTAQKRLLAAIAAEKSKAHPDTDWIRRLARELAAHDDREKDLRCGYYSDPGGRSRSPSFERWRDDRH